MIELLRSCVALDINTYGFGGALFTRSLFAQKIAGRDYEF